VIAVVTLYGRPECHLCDNALEIVRRVRADIGFELVQRDITLDDELHKRYLERIPVLTIDGVETFDLFVDEQELRRRLARVDGDELSRDGL